MALLQIAEPGQSPQPHQRRLAVGIDLGTTNSLVAALRSGLSEPLPDADGQVILLDAGVGVHGYQADISRTMVFGSPSRVWSDVPSTRSSVDNRGESPVEST